MENIITYLPLLAIAIAVNMALGVFGKLGVEKIPFDRHIFVNGIIKAAIIGVSFVGLAYIFDFVDLTSLGISPDLIMSAAIILYTGKACTKLASILGVTVEKNQ